MYDLTHLKTFITIVQEGNLTRAAERLRISQPAASHHIRTLEEHFGLPLLKRSSRGVEATAGGKLIAQWAGSVVDASRELDQQVREIAGASAARLAIGTISDQRLSAAYPLAVRAVQTRFPLTELRFEAGNTRTIRQAIKSGELDGGAVVGNIRGPDLKCHPLGALYYVLVGPVAWRERLEHARASQLAALPWVVTGRGTPSQEINDRFFKEEGLEINVAAEVSNAALLRTMVAGQVGLGFTRKETAAAGVRAGTLYVVPRFDVSLPVSFVHASARTSDAVLTCFVQALREHWDEDAVA